MTATPRRVRVDARNGGANYNHSETSSADRIDSQPENMERTRVCDDEQPQLTPGHSCSG